MLISAPVIAASPDHHNLQEPADTTAHAAVDRKMAKILLLRSEQIDDLSACDARPTQGISNHPQPRRR